MIEVLQTLGYVAGVLCELPFPVTFFILFLVFAFTIAPELAFDIYISQPTHFLGGIVLEFLLNMENSMVSSFQHACTESGRFLSATIHDGHPLLIFIITALLLSTLWCANRKRLLSQITNLKDRTTQIDLAHRRARNVFEANVKREKEARRQAEKELITILEGFEGARCPRGGNINLCLETKTVTHSCCKRREELEKEIAMLKSGSLVNTVKIERQKASIRSLQLQLEKKDAPKRYISSNAEHYASLYEKEKQKCEMKEQECEAYKYDITWLSKGKVAVEQRENMALRLLEKKDGEVKQLEKKLRAAKKVVNAPVQTIVSTPVVSHEALVKALKEDIESLKAKAKSAEKENTDVVNLWVNENLELRELNESLEEKVASLDKQVKTLQQANEKVESEKTELEASSEEASLKFGELQQAYEALSTEHSAKSSQHRSEVTVLSSHNGELKAQVKKLSKEIESHRQAASEQSAKEQRRIDALISEKGDLASRLLTGNDEEVRGLERQLSEAQTILASVSQNQMSLEAASRQIDELNQTNSKANNEIAALQFELQQEQASSRNLQNEVQAANVRIENLEQCAAKERPQKKMRQAAEEKYDDVKEARDRFEEQFMQAQNDIFDLVGENRDWKSIVSMKDELSKEVQEAREESKALRDNVAHLKGRLDELIQILHARDREIKELKAGGPMTEQQKRQERKEKADRLEQIRLDAIQSSRRS